MANPIFARVYSNVIAKGLERAEGPELRRRLLAGLTGTVVEVGAGDGANFSRYPDTVRRVVAVEPEPYLRERAAARAQEPVGVPVEVVDGDAARLPLPDASADAVVFCLVLCSVPEPGAALAEARRVLKPHGELRVLEHVRARTAGTARVQDLLDATVWPRLLGGCHCGRDTAAAVEAAGFDWEQLERFAFPEGSRMPMSPAILGRARLT